MGLHHRDLKHDDFNPAHLRGADSDVGAAPPIINFTWIKKNAIAIVGVIALGAAIVFSVT